MLRLPCNAQECVAANSAFAYPPLAKAARVVADVAARVRIKPDGSVIVTQISGHPLLVRFSHCQEIEALRYPVACSGQEVDIRLSYRLTDPRTEDDVSPARTTALAANRWQILGSPFHISDPAVTLGPKRGFWHRIFR